MLKHRLIACLLWTNGVLVQSMQFKHTNAVGNAYTAVDFFNTWAIDEIVLLDVNRQPDRDFFHDQLRELSMRCFIPLAVGGYITDLDEIKQLLEEGADKVVINTASVKDPEFIKQSAKTFGNQCIVVSIDTKKNENGKHEVFINRGKDAAGLSPIEHARTVEELGAGEIFLTSIDNDGQRGGYDNELVKSVADAVNIPVIASGGVGSWQHLVEGVESGADAVSAANIFHYFDQSTKKAKDFMKQAGVEVRRPEFYQVDMKRDIVYRI